MEELTGEVILEQLRKGPAVTAVSAGVLCLILAICMGISALMSGFFCIVTLILAGLALIALIVSLIALYKLIFVQKNRVLQQFGNPIAMAGCLRAGGTVALWQTPPYRKYPLMITEEYIVCPARVQSYLPLPEIRSLQRCAVQHTRFLRILMKSRSFAAAKDLSDSHKDRVFHAHHPLPDTERFDLLFLWDQKKHRHRYYVSAADFHDVLAFLREYQPEIQVKPEKTI